LATAKLALSIETPASEYEIESDIYFENTDYRLFSKI
jgi:hypothetical protein